MVASKVTAWRLCDEAGVKLSDASGTVGIDGAEGSVGEDGEAGAVAGELRQRFNSLISFVLEQSFLAVELVGCDTEGVT